MDLMSVPSLFKELVERVSGAGSLRMSLVQNYDMTGPISQDPLCEKFAFEVKF